MAHSDDNGLVLPPKLAPIQVVIIPIYKGDEERSKIGERLKPLIEGLKSCGISVKYDDADNKRPGFKFADYELKGVPVRIVMGSKDYENSTVEIMRRDTLSKETVSFDVAQQYVINLLDEIQVSIFEKARRYRDERTFQVDSYQEFKERIEDGCFVLAHWDGTAETEAKIKEETKATIRCLPMDYVSSPGRCVYSGKPSAGRVLFARSY